MRLLEGESLDLTEARRTTIRLWQEEWSRGVRPGEIAKGLWTKSLIPDLKVWLDAPGELTYHTSQVLSGHGQFQTYMVKIGKSDGDVCVLCDSRETDDVVHTVLRCSALREVRAHAPAVIQGKSIPEMVGHMLTDRGAWRETSSWLDAVMVAKEEKERERRARFGPTRLPGAEAGQEETRH